MDDGQDLLLTIDGVIEVLTDMGKNVEEAQGILASYLETESFIHNLKEYAE